MKRWTLESDDDLLIYHFSRIIQVNDRVLSDALYRVDNKDIALALLGSREEQKLKVFENVSKKRSIMIQDDINFYVKTYTKSGCYTAQEKIINAINDTILGIPPKNKSNKKMRKVRDYKNRLFTRIFTPDYYSHKTSGLTHQHTRSGRNWVRWFIWFILILVVVFTLIIWDKHSENIWDKASKAGWPSHRSSAPK